MRTRFAKRNAGTAPQRANKEEEEDVQLVYRTPRRRRKDAVGASHGNIDDNDVETQKRKKLEWEVDKEKAFLPRPSQKAANIDLSLRENALSISREQRALPETQFWTRCADINSHLSYALQQLDVHWERIYAWLHEDKKTQSHPPLAPADLLALFSSIPNDRVEVAHQALVDLQALLVRPPPDAAPNESKGVACWVPESYHEAAAALARLSEAALPCRTPSLLASSLTHQALAKGKATAPPGCTLTIHGHRCVPSPVSAYLLEARLGHLRRLRQLRFTYNYILLPMHKYVMRPTAIQQFLFSEEHSGAAGSGHDERGEQPSPSNYFCSLHGSSSQHFREGEVLRHLLDAANRQSTVDIATWGPLAAPRRLHVKDGVYVVHTASRQEVMRAILKECELYGLPAILRSMRRNAGARSTTALPSSASSFAAADPGVTAVAQSHEEQSIFLSVASLDPSLFAPPPDRTHWQLVQEVLIGLACKYCAFGMVVGAVDQVLYILKMETQYAAYRRRHHASRVGEEREKENEDTGYAGRNVLASYARNVAVDTMAAQARAEAEEGSQAAQDSQKKAEAERATRVDWLVDNRCWGSPTHALYGLVYAVVLQPDLIAQREEEGEEGEEDAKKEKPLPDQQEPAYYICSLVELVRS